MPRSIAELLEAASAAPCQLDHLAAQVQEVAEKLTRSQKPYLELTLVDATGSFSLKVWNNHAQWDDCEKLKPRDCVSLKGTWNVGDYGLESNDWALRPLKPAEQEIFFQGDEKLAAIQAKDYQEIERLVSEMTDPRLKQLSEHFLEKFGERFRRTAAARKNHHARRGGLVEHTAQMMRLAAAIAPLYEEVHLDLVLAGVLFHDCGKLWENNYDADSFAQSTSQLGELIGHIPLGMEIINQLWREVEQDDWADFSPKSDQVRLHLLHLVASHHGELQFGSPLVPKTAEAYLLHHIDNLDAKMEMVREGYRTSPQDHPGIYNKRWPLGGNLIRPLAPFSPPEHTPPQ